MPSLLAERARWNGARPMRAVEGNLAAPLEKWWERDASSRIPIRVEWSGEAR